MSRQCDALGTKPMVGNSRSHALNATKRRFLPNLQKKTLNFEGKKFTLTLSTRAIRTLDKLGIEAFLKRFGFVK